MGDAKRHFNRLRFDSLHESRSRQNRTITGVSGSAEFFDPTGVKSVRLPARSPNLNSFAERFVRSIKSECLDRMILIGEPSLRRAVDQFVVHYHLERNHQGLENTIIEPEFGSGEEGEVNCRERLGGLPRYYYRDAA